MPVAEQEVLALPPGQVPPEQQEAALQLQALHQLLQAGAKWQRLQDTSWRAGLGAGDAAEGHGRQGVAWVAGELGGCMLLAEQVDAWLLDVCTTTPGASPGVLAQPHSHCT